MKAKWLSLVILAVVATGSISCYRPYGYRFYPGTPRFSPTHPAEVDLLLGDPARAIQKLNWKPKVDFDGLVNMMVDADLELAEREKRADG